MFGSNAHILGDPGKDALSSLAQILQNTRIKTLTSDLSRNMVNIYFSMISYRCFLYQRSVQLFASGQHKPTHNHAYKIKLFQAGKK